MRFRCHDVKAVFDDVKITSRQSHGTKIVKRVISSLKIVSLVTAKDLCRNFRKVRQRPIVDLDHLLLTHRVGFRVKTFEIAECVPERITNFTVRIDYARQYLIRTTYIFSVIDSRRPKPQDLGTRFIDYLLR